MAGVHCTIPGGSAASSLVKQLSTFPIRLQYQNTAIREQLAGCSEYERYYVRAVQFWNPRFLITIVADVGMLVTRRVSADRTPDT